MTPRILVSNDDGIHAPGLHALVEAVSSLGEVWVVAPEKEQSATSHSLSLHHPLRIRKQQERWFGVDGTPADSVYIAVNHLMKDARPTLVLSGINHGPNLADDVIYSGTVAAAMEGSILGFPAIAFSLVTRKNFDFTHAKTFVHSLVKTAITQSLPPRMLLNVNMPAYGEITGYEVTRLGRHTYGADVVEKEDPRGRRYYWIGGTGYEHVKENGTDVTCVHDFRRASVTPLMLDLTHHELLAPLREWKLEGFTQES
ncbi:MAG: 5'/3'-nucleotidase SurE [Archangium gephyra]|uniref:5'-nucleotidase SurE n=1 Tax=Archangium gephyra TaxID=48 RepID=A0A2W5VC14_9BACT|nr:MAG: 5'/3'-nucleotidase SurE [Archangium gephyra]